MSFEMDLRVQIVSFARVFLYREEEGLIQFVHIDVFDVYIQRNNNKVFLVDFNPFDPTTDAILYDWSELMACKCA